MNFRSAIECVGWLCHLMLNINIDFSLLKIIRYFDRQILGGFAIFWVDGSWLVWVSSVALPPPGGASLEHRLNSHAPILHQRHSYASHQNFRISNDSGTQQKINPHAIGMRNLNQFGHKRCRHCLDMGGQTSPRREINILVKFFPSYIKLTHNKPNKGFKSVKRP